MLLVLKMAEKEITSGSDEVAEILSCNCHDATFFFIHLECNISINL